MGSFLFLIITVTIQFYSFTTVAQESFPTNFIAAQEFCLGGNYSDKSSFGTNIHLLLSSLSSHNIKMAIDKGYYYNNTIGQSPDVVYGSVQCRGNITNLSCRNCVDVFLPLTKQRCPTSKQAIIWGDDCMVRYSNQSYFSIMEETPALNMANSEDVSNPNLLNPVLDRLLNDIVSEATSTSSSKFGTKEANFTTTLKVYVLAQCTFDISTSDCNICLRKAISEFSSCCSGSQGARVIKPSCYARYEIYPFFHNTMIAKTTTGTAPPPTGTAPPPTGTRFPPLTTITAPPTISNAPPINKSWKGKKSSKLYVVIVIPSVIVVISIISIWYFCLRTTKAEENFKGVDKIRRDESFQFSFVMIKAATNNFSDDNKLGRGGFGSVYKGTLPDGQEIAVKRLSKNSCQGEEC